MSKKQVIKIDENPTLFSFFGGSILVAIFTSVSKSIYTGTIIFHFEPFFCDIENSWSLKKNNFYFQMRFLKLKKNTFSN